MHLESLLFFLGTNRIAVSVSNVLSAHATSFDLPSLLAFPGKTFSNRFMGRHRIYGHTSDGTAEKGRLCATGFSAAKDSQGGIIR